MPDISTSEQQKALPDSSISATLPLSQRLTFKLARIAVITAFLLGLLLSTVQLAFDYSGEIKQLNSTVDQILRVASAPARRAVFELNSDLANEVVDSLHEYEFVSQARLTEKSLGLFAERHREYAADDNQDAISSLVAGEIVFAIDLAGYSAEEDSLAEPIGQLELVVDRSVALAPFKQRSLLVIGAGVLRSLLFALLLLVVFHFLIGRGLLGVVRHLGRIDPALPAKNILPVETRHSRDEIGLLSNSINVLFRTIEDNTRQLEDSEAALKLSETRFKSYAEAASDWFWETDSAGRFVFISERFFTLTGQTQDDIIGQSALILQNPENGETGWDDFVKKLCLGFAFRDCRCQIRDSNGELRELSIYGQPNSDSSEQTGGFSGTAADISQQVAAESQLRQAQKMQAVGHLTGGVAHDFNNLLMVVIGNLDLSKYENLTEDKKQEYIDRAIKAAERGADLTQRLLAFSRKQPLAPKTINANILLRGMDDLFRRTLGENIEIELITAAGLWMCEADESQLENALLNLAINARDAMSDGGKLTLETGNVHFDDSYAARDPELQPGQYVQIAVTDTGHGIPKDLFDRIFEPFFTTKGMGRGSGLGLSMVYGFAKQSGGHLNVYSEIDQGTTMRLYLPRSLSQEEVPADQNMDDMLHVATSEKILVVEDEPEVLSLVLTILDSTGYQVSTAKSGDEALAKVEAGLKPELLLTDAVLPGNLNGAKLAIEIQERIPSLKILYMSGYTENAIVHGGRLDPGILLLQKPFRRQDLLSKVRQALDRE